MSDEIPQAPNGEIIFFQSADGSTRVECRFESDSLWLTQALIAELYQKNVRTINEHLQNIYSEAELDQNSTIRNFRILRDEGARQVNRSLDHYNLEAILAVGYRVKSVQGTQFRKWATATLQEYLIKGFVMDDERLKNPPVGDSAVPDYFDEMLERIRDIRASERRMYLRVKDIFILAADYKPRFNVLILPLEERDKIVELIDEKASKMDVLIKKAESAICFIRARRTALISAAVASKINLRSWQAPQPSNTKSKVVLV